MNKIKIAFVDHARAMGGAEYSLYYLLKELDYNMVQPYLLTPPNSELQKMVENLPSVRVVNMELDSIKNFKGFIKDIRDIRRFCKQEHIDIVHTNSYRGAIYGLIGGKLARKKTVWHVRDIHESILFKSILPRLSDKIITISNAVSNQFSKDTIHKKVNLIYNGVDLKLYNVQDIKGDLKSELSISKDTFLIGMVGRIDRWKGFHYLIKSASIIKNSPRKFKIVIVGDEILTKEKGYLDELKRLVIELDLEDKVDFLGARKDIPNVMKSLDLFISYSNNEPFGRVIIEALAMKTPVIVANSGGAPEIILDSNCGDIVESNNEEHLAKSMIQFMELSQQSLDLLGENGKRRIEEFFSTELVAVKVTELYKKLYNN
ncbi:TPA: glycosyltransferase family 4 protein [Bacillus cereus]